MTQRIIALLMLLCPCLIMQSQTKRPVTPLDCVNVKYVFDDVASYTSGIQLNPQGTKVAYLVKVPNLRTNKNDVELYVKTLKPESEPEKLILTESPVLQMQWLSDGEHITVLANDDGRMSVVEVDVRSGVRTTLVRAPKDINEYSIDSSGSVVVYAQEDYDGDQHFTRTAEESARGYRLVPETTMDQSVVMPTRKLYAVSRSASGKWGEPKEIIIHSPFSHREISSIAYYRLMFLRMSPDGKKILFRYTDYDPAIPEGWKNNSLIKMQHSTGNSFVVFMVEYDTEQRTTSLPLLTPQQAAAPMWSPDSKSFIVSAISPVGSEYERDDVRSNRPYDPHLFWVSDGGVAKIIPSESNQKPTLPIFWTQDGVLGISSGDAIGLWIISNREWVRKSTISLPMPQLATQDITGDLNTVIAEYDSKLVPPEIRIIDLKAGTAYVMVRLNPEFDHLSLAIAEKVQWHTSDGYAIYGTLLKPPNYREGMRYPLLIETKTGGDRFECDTGFNHYPSFIPQPAASAGIMYLTRAYTKDLNYADELQHYPKGYPGQVSEAAFQTDIWDSAVDMLDKKGVIDRDRIGIIGFSRSGWYTEFALVHGRTKYRAATVTDSVEYNIGAYILFPIKDAIRGSDMMYGGPPEGSTRKNWLDYSISFNIDKIHTPILREKMGYGVQYDDEKKRPLGLELQYELFAGLNRLGRPIEMYYYPNESHEPDHPQARLATLQRNLDWYRFWLQDYERPNPEDPDQYIRWRKFRETQDTEDRAAGQSPASPSTPN